MAALIGGPVAVVGLGLIGGSLAQALAGAGILVSGVTDREEDVRAARAAGLRAMAGRGAIEGAVAGAETVVIATPLDAVADVSAEVLAAISESTLVLHVAGLQSQRAVRLEAAAATRVIGTHPLAGSHEQGFGSARSDLFRDALVSAEARASAEERARIEALWLATGARRVIYRTAEEHDWLMAWVSHLPQLAATVLAATVAGRGIAPSDAGPGLRDTTRLAASPFALWRPMLAASPQEAAEALRALEARLAGAREAITRADWAELDALWSEAREWRASHRS